MFLKPISGVEEKVTVGVLLTLAAVIAIIIGIGLGLSVLFNNFETGFAVEAIICVVGGLAIDRWLP